MEQYNLRTVEEADAEGGAGAFAITINIYIFCSMKYQMQGQRK